MILKDKGCGLSTTGYYLVIAGAINWGLVGLGSFFGGNWNLVNMLFGRFMMVESLLYVVIGLSGVLLLVGCRCSTCSKCRADMGMGDKPEVKV